MKKLVTLLLAVVLVLGLASTAFAATLTDIGDLSKDSQAAVSKLNALGVIGGYPDGTFKPAGNITRAEFAKIAVQLAGMGATQEGLKNSASQFADVKAGVWYTGWINLATSQGYLMGYPDGTFRPDAKITYEEVVTILLRILGYDSNLAGPWPTEYIAKAAALGITDDIAFNVGAFATRADVAMMAKELLEEYMVTWAADSQNFVNNANYIDTKNDQGITLLAYSFKGLVKEDFVVTDWAKDDDGFSIEVADFDKWDRTEDTIDKIDKKDRVSYDLTDDAVILGADTVPALGGMIVDYIDKDGDIAYVEVTSTVLYSDDVDVNDDDEVTVGDDNYELADNFIDEDDDLVAPDDIDNDDFYDVYLTEDGEVYDYLDETQAVADGDYDVRLVDQNKGTKLTFKTSHGDSGSLTDLDTKDLLVVKDGKYAELKDIAENDVVYVDDVGNGALDLYLKVFTIKDSGTFDADYTDKWKIGGTKYVVNADAEISRDNGDEFETFNDPKGDDLLDGVFDETVTYYRNYANQVEFLIANVEDDADVVYGLVNDIVDTTSKGYVTRVEILKADGNMQKYDVDLDELEILDGDELSAYQLIRFKLNDAGDIEDLTILAVADAYGVYSAYDDAALDDYTDKDYDDYAVKVVNGDADKKKVEIVNEVGDNLFKYTNADTVVFNAFPGVTDGDDAVITDTDDFLDWAEDFHDGQRVYVQYDGSKIEYILVCDTDIPGTSYKYGAVVGKSYRSGDDRKVEVDTKGTAKTYVQANEIKTYKVGELYEYYLDGSDFTVKNSIFDPANIYDADGSGWVDADGDDEESSVAKIVYAVLTVKSIDTDNDAIELYIDKDNDGRVDSDENVYTWELTDDTAVYDYSDYFDDGSKPVWAELADFEADDLIMIGYTNDSYDDGELTSLFKVNNMRRSQVNAINAGSI